MNDLTRIITRHAIVFSPVVLHQCFKHRTQQETSHYACRDIFE